VETVAPYESESQEPGEEMVPAPWAVGQTEEETPGNLLAALSSLADRYAPADKPTKYKLHHWALTWRWKAAVKNSELPPQARDMALWLAEYMRNDIGVCWPTQETMARERRRSISTIKRWVVVLEKRGWVEVDRTGRADHRPNRYTLTFPGDALASHKSYSR
jgi:hypothetical protein